jgi:hypothetical protein
LAAHDVAKLPATGKRWPSSTLSLSERTLRVRRRDDWEPPSPVIPDATDASTIEPFPTSNLFALGHRLSLRLDIFGRVRWDDGASSHRRERSLPTPRTRLTSSCSKLQEFGGDDSLGGQCG